MRILPPEICSGVSQITYIRIRDEKPAQLPCEYVLGGVVGSDWTANTLLENLIISRTQSNSRTCAYALTNDVAQIILACTSSIMPGLELSFLFWRILISLLLVDIWLYILHIWTRLRLLYRTRHILYYCVALPWWVPDYVWHCWCRRLQTYIFRPPTTSRQQHPLDATKACVFNLWQPCNTLMTLLTVWDGFSLPFFVVWWTRDND